MAAGAVRSGDCDWALAGGVCVMGSPAIIYDFAKQNALATDGHCRVYADDSSGTLWGEGAGFVVVEPESRARRLGHRVFGRILGSHYNHNGKGKPILTPRPEAQEKLFRRVIDKAGIDAADVGMIEGHGTATRAGDRAELTALLNTYGAAGSAAFVGSAKSNLGHAQAAGGMLGVIKVLLAGWHGHVPASLFTENPTTEVDWESSSLRLATKLHPWEAKDGTGTARSRRTARTGSTRTPSSACRSERSTTISELPAARRNCSGTAVGGYSEPAPRRGRRTVGLPPRRILRCHRNAWRTCYFGRAPRGDTVRCPW